jgi:hypothetical protein
MPDQTSQRPSEEGLRIMMSRLDDDRRLIAAGKVQRWEIFKWTVALNLGLAAAFAYKENAREPLWPYLIFAAVVTAYGVILFWYINRRLTRTRTEGNALSAYLEKVHRVDVERIIKEAPAADNEYDWQELRILLTLMLLSLSPLVMAVSFLIK